ncbi:hypothetical protein BGW41_004182 [Actinomortierella wolfii]|nr:hypothetical protein BGW41_004182 [Actinomortierella wolfii]
MFNRDLDDLPSDIVDLNCAVIQNEQGSLLCNKLQLYLSYNLFTSVPKAIFSLKNLSVLSLRNNHLTELPPEIGLLQNLVELSIGGNQLKYLPWQVTQLSKLVILNVHPNPFLHPPELPSTPGVSSTASGGDTPTTFAMLHDQNLATTQTVRGVGNFATEPLSPPPTPNLTPLSESIQAADEGDEPPFSHAYSSSGVSSSSLSTSANTLPGSGVGRDSSSDSSGGSSSSSSMEQPLPVEELFAIGVERPVVATEESNEAEEVDEEEDHSPPLRAQVRKSKFPSLKVIAGNVLLRSMVKRMTANKSDKGRTSLVAAGKQPSSATPLSPAPPPLVTQESTTTESSKNNKSDNDQKDADEEDEYDSLHQSGADSGSNVGRREREAHSMRRHKKRTHSVSWDMDHHRSQPSRPKAEEQTGVDGPESLSCTMSHPAKDSPLPPPLPRSSASPAVVDRRVVTTSNKVSAGSTCPSKVEAETAMICQRTRMQSALTPYLFEAIDHALTTRLTCPGCNQPIWKSCQRIIVWHEVVGQAMQVPVEYGGCGLATCPGLPPRLLKHVRMCT